MTIAQLEETQDNDNEIMLWEDDGFQEYINIKELEKEVLNSIKGQDKQVKQVITAIYRSLCFQDLKSNVLIIGNSGTGKSEIIKQIAKNLDIAYTIEDATKYTKEGYKGASVEDMLKNLYANAGSDYWKAKKGILVIDEIDKKVNYREDENVSGKDVLNSLLKIIEGTKIPIDARMTDPNTGQSIKIRLDFDTSDLTVICLGAFNGLEKIREKRLSTNQFGFSVPSIQEQKDSRTRFIKADLVEYGIPEEFAGRINTIVEMNKLTESDLTLILKESDLSVLEKYVEALFRKGIIVDFEDELFDCIAKEAMEVDTGARELNNVVNYMFENAIYDILANPGKYDTLTLFLETVQDNTKYELSHS